MKKANPTDSRSTTKRKAAPKNIDEYLAGVPEPARSTLKKIRAAIRSAVPLESTEVISYGIPAFKHKAVLVWFAAFKNHCSFFPMNSSVIEAHKNELEDCQVSKGTIRFPVDKPLSAGLIKELVKARLAQIERKKGR